MKALPSGRSALQDKAEKDAMRGRITTGLLIGMAMLAQGCAIAPGMTMDEPAELPEGKVIRVQTLTMDLLSQLEAQRQTQVRELAEKIFAALKIDRPIINSVDMSNLTWRQADANS